MGDFFKHLVPGILIIFVVWAIAAGVKSTYQFSSEEVRPQLERVLGTSEYDVIDESNNSVWVGTPGDVTYNIRLRENGEVVSCKCTDGIFQPRLCRKYE
jgi:hypothetical protein